MTGDDVTSAASNYPTRIENSVLNEYRHWRKKGHNAKNALSLAKRGDPPFEMQWSDVNNPQTFERDGFTIGVKVEPDQSDYGDYLGEFTDEWSEGVVESPRANWHVVENWRGEKERVAGNKREYKWFLPQITEEEHYRDLCEYKFGKAEARRLARKYTEDALNRALEYEAWVVIVTVYRDGIELASDALGGIDVDSFDEIAWIVDDHGMIEEAIERARTSLEKLSEFRQHARKLFGMVVDDREHAIVLLALRALQANFDEFVFFMEGYYGIDPVPDAEEIDSLCERLNTEA